MAGRLQNEDFKSSAELVSAGGTASQLLNDTKVWVTGGSLNTTLDQAITTGQIGGGGSKNYITYKSFENNATTGWSLASSTLDATSKLPNQASGSWGAAAGTLAISTVGAGSQLAGNYSLSLASSAASTAGNMLVSQALTLDLEAQASIQTFSFFYKIASGSANINLSGTSLNSIGVAIYDVTNGAWIDPAGRYNIVQSSGVGKASGTFQVPANCTSVRLAVYFPNASSGAFQILLDDFVLGPQVVQYGAPVTDWQQYTPTLSSNSGTITNSTVTAFWRRIGGQIEVRASIGFSGAVGTWSRPFLTLPFPADTSVGGGSQAFGFTQNARVQSGGVPYFNLYCELDSATRLRVFSTSASVGGGFSELTESSPVTINTTSSIVIQVSYPAAGLSSSVQMSNDTDTRVVDFSAIRATSIQTIAAGSYSTVQFNSVKKDSHSAWNAGTYKYTVPVSGDYFVSYGVTITTGVSAPTDINLVVLKNGSSASLFLASFANDLVASKSRPYNKSGIITGLSAGDTLEMAIACSANNCSVDFGNSGSEFSSFTIQRLSGPSVIAANETVRARVVMSANQSFGISVFYPNLNVKTYDSHGAMSASGVFTAPISGLYSVKMSLGSDGTATFPTTQGFDIGIEKNGTTLISQLGISYGNGTTNINQVIGSDSIYLNAGETIRMRCSSGVAFTAAAAFRTFFAVERVGS